jgi:monofunctional glycosyltransferase
MLRRIDFVCRNFQVIISIMTCLIFRWPYLCFANMFLFFGFFDLQAGIKSCLSSISTDLDEIPDAFVDVLIAAEDHRNQVHFGVDPFAIARSLIAYLMGSRQGGSTIEQQFVRVTLASYELTLFRKIREQFLATLLSRRVSRRTIAKSYLVKAYYGTELTNLHALERNYKKTLQNMCLDEVIEITARLKYPQPQRMSAVWRAKFRRRCSWIKARLEAQQVSVNYQSKNGAVSLRRRSRFQP